MTSRIALIALTLLAAGCRDRDHGTPDVPRAAVAIALAWTEAGSPAIDPPSPPSPDGETADVCWNCKGRGKVGDGVTMLTCPVCGGSGRSTPMSYQEPPSAESIAPVVDIVNEDERTPELAITWETDHATALRLAAELDGGYVIAVCSPDWFDCGPCRALVTALTPHLADAAPEAVWLKVKLPKADALKLQGKKRLEECSFPYLAVLAPRGDADAGGLVTPIELAKGPVTADPKSLSPILKRASARALQLHKEQTR